MSHTSLVQQFSLLRNLLLLPFDDAFPPSLRSLSSFCRSIDVFLFVYLLAQVQGWYSIDIMFFPALCRLS